MESAFIILFNWQVKYRKNLIKQTWPYLDTLVILYRNLLQTGLDGFLFLIGGDCWLVNHLFSPTLLKGLLSLKFTEKAKWFLGNSRKLGCKEGQRSEHAFNLKFWMGNPVCSFEGLAVVLSLGDSGWCFALWKKIILPMQWQSPPWAPCIKLNKWFDFLGGLV